MSMAESLALVVKTETKGVLETNIGDMEAFVKERLKDYEPDIYMGDASEAKKDRAELNDAKKKLGKTRIAVINRLMAPYREFEDRCKALESLIDEASGKLDAIVKAKENEEREAKRKLIEMEWQSADFDLVPLDKVFNSRWLNKTYKMADVAKDIKEIISTILKDLKTIEKFADDAETLKAHYLISLDIGETLDYGEELKKKRELAQKEVEARTEREHRERIEAQKSEVRHEAQSMAKKASVSGIVAEALGEEPVAVVKEYVLSMSLTESQLIGIKNYLCSQGIEYECNELEF